MANEDHRRSEPGPAVQPVACLRGTTPEIGKQSPATAGWGTAQLTWQVAQSTPTTWGACAAVAVGGTTVWQMQPSAAKAGAAPMASAATTARHTVGVRADVRFMTPLLRLHRDSLGSRPQGARRPAHGPVPPVAPRRTAVAAATLSAPVSRRLRLPVSPGPSPVRARWSQRAPTRPVRVYGSGLQDGCNRRAERKGEEKIVRPTMRGRDPRREVRGFGRLRRFGRRREDPRGDEEGAGGSGSERTRPFSHGTLPHPEAPGPPSTAAMPAGAAATGRTRGRPRVRPRLRGRPGDGLSRGSAPLLAHVCRRITDEL